MMPLCTKFGTTYYCRRRIRIDGCYKGFSTFALWILTRGAWLSDAQMQPQYENTGDH